MNLDTPTLYAELHRIAERHLRGERALHTLQPTALVNEAFVKLLGAGERRYADQVHFLAVASRVMRQVLVDYARSRSADKRGGGWAAAEFTASLEIRDESGAGLHLVDLIALDSALAALAAESEPLARLIEMRYFAGLTAEESAEALGLSPHVVRHDLRFAHAWLRRYLTRTPSA